MAQTSQVPGFEQLSLNTARLLQAQSSYRGVLAWLGGIAVTLLLVLFLPWQQNVQGKGKLSALSPQDRLQMLTSRIDGRVEKWFVPEGAFVKAGTPIVEISEIKDEYMDPRLSERTGEQLSAKESANRGKLGKADALSRQIDALERSLTLKNQQARNKVTLYSAAVEQAVLEDSLARDQYRRRETLYASPLGLSSLNELQAARMRQQSAAAKLVEKRNELLNATVDLEGIEAEYREKIEKASGDRLATLADVDEGRGEVSKLRNKLASLDVRSSYYRIDAPQDGYFVKAMKQGVGEVVKAGEPVATVQPVAKRRAVELFVRPMDVPLLRRGSKVRLIFDGWPALQFSGWPSVSVGTFGGQVAVIDQVASADGSFRVLVSPDSTDEAWPEQLRLGSGVNGWAALQTVRVWFEIWRQLNGFPPSIKSAEEAAAAIGKKK